MSIVNSSKRVIQIIQLLDERSMSFSFCLNKFDLLALCGLTLLYQAVELKADSKLTRDIGKLVNVAIKSMNNAKAPGCIDLARIAATLISVDTHASPLATNGSMAAPPQRSSSKESRRKPDLWQDDGQMRRMNMPNRNTQEPEFYAPSRQSLDSVNSSDGSTMHPGHRLSVPQQGNINNTAASARGIPNLDYLSLNNNPSHTGPSSPAGVQRLRTAASSLSPSGQAMGTVSPVGKVPEVSTNEWETLLGSMDGGLNNVYDAIYGGATLISDTVACNPSTASWTPDSWDLSGIHIGDFGPNPEPPRSVFSMSEESLSSGEEVAPSELGLSVGSAEFSKLHMTEAYGFDLEGFPL
jgi:hypothetical protein